MSEEVILKKKPGRIWYVLPDGRKHGLDIKFHQIKGVLQIKSQTHWQYGLKEGYQFKRNPDGTHKCSSYFIEGKLREKYVERIDGEFKSIIKYDENERIVYKKMEDNVYTYEYSSNGDLLTKKLEFGEYTNQWWYHNNKPVFVESKRYNNEKIVSRTERSANGLEREYKYSDEKLESMNEVIYDQSTGLPKSITLYQYPAGNPFKVEKQFFEDMAVVKEYKLKDNVWVATFEKKYWREDGQWVC